MRGWFCTVAVAIVVAAAAAAVVVVAVAAAATAAAVVAAEDDDEDEACARCSRHGIPDRSSMISSSPSSTTHHSPAEAEVNARVLAVSRRPAENPSVDGQGLIGINFMEN